MPDNLLIDPELNPIIFYDDNLTTSDEFQTPHFEYFPFDKRGKDWLQMAAFYQLWQTTDIIPLQFESQFDPIVISLLDENDTEVITLPALVGLPNIFYPNTWSFEVAMSLAGLTTGFYRLKRVLGAAGPMQKTQYSRFMFISSEPIDDTIFIQYWHSRFHKDVVFETGIKFGIRVPGWIDYDRQGRVYKQDLYRDERWNNTLLNSKSAKNVPVYFGDEFGLPTDILNIIEQIFECDHVLIDNKQFGLAEGAKMEYNDIEGYRLRGMHTVIEPGINRNSRMFSIDTDPEKKFLFSIMVDKKAVGDTGNQGSSNTIPVLNEE